MPEVATIRSASALSALDQVPGADVVTLGSSSEASTVRTPLRAWSMPFAVSRSTAMCSTPWTGWRSCRLRTRTVVLDRLTPAERIAFVLHDMVDVPFSDIAHMMQRSVAAVRQLASRARSKVHGHRTG